MDFSKKKIKINDNTVVQGMGTGIVILNLNTEHFYELDNVGKRFWETINSLQEYNLIYDVLLQEYEVSEEQLQTDINALIDDLIKAELIELI